VASHLFVTNAPGLTVRDVHNLASLIDTNQHLGCVLVLIRAPSEFLGRRSSRGLIKNSVPSKKKEALCQTQPRARTSIPRRRRCPRAHCTFEQLRPPAAPFSRCCGAHD
jgi:hypothetical protein